MPPFEPRAENYHTRVEQSFGRQRVMKTLGVALVRVAPGEVELRLPFDEKLAQQHGFVHGGVVSMALDSACGYAAFSLMPADASVLTVEFKVNFLAPAKGEHFTFVGTVVKPGKSITVSRGDAHAWSGGQSKLIAQMTATMMAVSGRPGIRG